MEEARRLGFFKTLSAVQHAKGVKAVHLHKGNFVMNIVKKFVRFVGVLAIVILSATMTTGALAQTIIRVDGVNGLASPTGTTPGDAWNNAFKYLQDALTHAGTLTGTVHLWVSDGSYRPDHSASNQSGTNNRNATFLMTNSIAIFGGFAGNGATNPDLRDLATHVSILSGNLDNQGIATDNAYHVVTANTISGGVSNGISFGHLDGFTIRDGYAVDAPVVTTTPNDIIPAGSAAGLLSYRPTNSGVCAPVITRCIFEHNTAKYGSAMFLAGGQNNQPKIYNCTFRPNENAEVTTGVYGPGTVYVQSSLLSSSTDLNAQFVNCLWHENTSGLGSAILVNNDAYATLRNCTITGNSTYGTASSAVMQIEDTGLGRSPGQTRLRNCIIFNNVGDIGGTPTISFSTQVGSSNLVYSYCCINGLQCQIDGDSEPDPDGTGSIGCTPNFVSVGADDYRIACPSGTVNLGSNSEINTIDDPYDLDQDSDINEDVPGLDGQARIVATTVDMGSFETPVNLCRADINGNTEGVPDGTVNVQDLLYLLEQWSSSCPCAADIAPSPCGGDGFVNTQDLLALIAAWGADCPSGVINDLGYTVQDCYVCIDAANLVSEPFSEDWYVLIDACLDKLEE